MGPAKALTRGGGSHGGGGRGGVAGAGQGHEVPVLVREGERARHGDRGQVQPLLHRRDRDPREPRHAARPASGELKREINKMVATKQNTSRLAMWDNDMWQGC